MKNKTRTNNNNSSNNVVVFLSSFSHLFVFSPQNFKSPLIRVPHKFVCSIFFSLCFYNPFGVLSLTEATSACDIHTHTPIHVVFFTLPLVVSFVFIIRFFRLDYGWSRVVDNQACAHKLYCRVYLRYEKIVLNDKNNGFSYTLPLAVARAHTPNINKIFIKKIKVKMLNQKTQNIDNLPSKRVRKKRKKRDANECNDNEPLLCLEYYSFFSGADLEREREKNGPKMRL